ncbi:UDP-glucuronosyl/UDP-glucosyltransferase [Artemisia annua]|uniref:UDP-glucuronosyl/UDP-glucosyltransferase n=1 Tax=Artemisia annua TaxID=35608 RepID=A0A2U1LAG4_ARTAN|nr:UDP-glucuronosyl/UDP-glucosyltransferase [Artemisia annua]
MNEEVHPITSHPRAIYHHSSHTEKLIDGETASVSPSRHRENPSLPFPSHPDIPPGVENVADLPFFGFKYVMVNLGELYKPITDWFHSHPSPPLGIHRYIFSPTGALGLSIINSLCGYNDDDHADLISFPNIPNSPTFPWWHLAPKSYKYVKGEPTIEFVNDCLSATLVSWGVIINLFTELDGVYYDHIKAEVGHDRVFEVGPLLLPSKYTTERGGSNTTSSDDVLSWLDTCAAKTVVFVSFGSQVVLSNKQMEEIALGLENSGVKFLWVVKEPTGGHATGEYGNLPVGFEDRVAGWVPQVAILNHGSVGVLLSHCGWNSIMEALTAGVLVLTWPMSADNFANALLLHDQKLGLKACEGVDTIPDSADLARLFRKSACDEAHVERNRATKFALAARAAVVEGGTSWID